MDYISYYKSPLGNILLASDGEFLTGLWFEKQKYYAENLSNNFMEKNLPIFEESFNWLDIYFSGKEPDFMPKIKMKATDFRIKVWQILQSIPYGQTMTYKQIAVIIAKERKINRMSAQAIGGAVGHNPISIIIPCHRVIGANGNLTGYAGGLDKKL
ncbi:MAG: methylated-DNA--[protein]-cysteine S-methyltransferase, partial [Candidatus Riflebacteria bacterium]|nr:methylated-DNA--[protein]-cysteine S-methyltransferase [Candidatus Riflebacteria bacterium]